MMFDSEMELEKYLSNNPHENEEGVFFNDILCEKYFDFEETQVALGSYGTCDILRMSYDPEYEILNIQITEVKKEEVDHKALFQLMRYRKGLERYFSKIEHSYDVIYEGVLVGTSINKSSDFVYCFDFIDWIDFYTIELSLECGATPREERGYMLTQENKNYSKFEDYLITLIHGVEDSKKEGESIDRGEK